MMEKTTQNDAGRSDVVGRIGEGQSSADKFRNYDMRIVRPGSEPIDVHNEAVDVRVRDVSGLEYSANFVTSAFLDVMFEKNKRTGECADGSYFAMPGMIVVRQVDEGTIKRTIDDMIKNEEIELYFYKVD